MTENFEYFQISQKGLLFRDDKILIVKLADQTDSWDLPGGRIDKKEADEVAFFREIKEELGFSDFKNLGVVDYEICYVKDTPFCGIVNLIKNDDNEIKLSEEHSQYKWINENEISDYKYAWKNMDRMMKKGFQYYKLLQKNEK